MQDKFKIQHANLLYSYVQVTQIALTDKLVMRKVAATDCCCVFVIILSSLK